MNAPGERSRGALRILPALLVATLALACEGSPRSATYKLPELGRSYELVSRSDPEAARPAAVLFALHAFQIEPSVLAERWNLRELAVERRGWLLVVPEGNRNSHGQRFWNASSACCDAERSQPDDLGYLRAVLRDVGRRHAVDPRRVYAIGVSNGGFMAHAWACAQASELGGIVSVSGAGPGEGDAPCAPAHAVSVLQVHGDADRVVQYRGGRMNDRAHPSAHDSLRPWLGPNGCRTDAPEFSLSEGLFQFTTRAETWACSRAPLALWTVPGAGHHFRPGIGFVDKMLRFLETSPRSK